MRRHPQTMATYRIASRNTGESSGLIRKLFTLAALGTALYQALPDSAPNTHTSGANDNINFAQKENSFKRPELTILPSRKPTRAQSTFAAKASYAPQPLQSSQTPQPYYIYKANNGNEYPIDRQTYDAIEKTSKKTGIPAESIMAVCARESSCRPQEINPSSGACGLKQLMTNHIATLYEVTFKYAEKAGYPEAKKLVERYARAHDKKGNPYYSFRPVNEVAKNKLVNMCLNAEFNLAMWAEYTLPKIEKHETWLGTGRKLTPGEFVAMNNIGQYGLQLFFEQVMSDIKTGKNTPVKDFFEKHKSTFGNVSANRTLLYDKNGKNLSVRESYNSLINQHGGWGEMNLAKASPL
ncbi:MAG: transglycosylase SLT domain-containing protein [Alphaproteobacteria bacterium]|nr:transglycosylase SLT domain-containing protein [Alphaproteobacteria bacterium]